MRFLLFNVVVAAALVFLFAGDRADLHAAADRAHDAATDLKARAFEVIGAKKAPDAPPAPQTAAKPVQEKAAVSSAPKTAPPAAEPVPAATDKAGTAGVDAVTQVRVATRGLVPPLPPEVGKRREEVLAEGVVGGAISSPGDTKKPKFMTAADRKRDLMLLSEEMEMFSAQSIAR